MALNPDIIKIQKYAIKSQPGYGYTRTKIWWLARPPFGVYRPFPTWAKAAEWLSTLHAEHEAKKRL